VTYPSAEPAQERRVNPESVRRVGLFSHPPESSVFEPGRSRLSGGVDWRATPFSTQSRSDVAPEDHG
jgi:hypothetical protein